MERKRKQFAQGIGGVRSDAYFESIPPGWQFRPSKKHLLGYLKAKVLKQPLPANRIHEADLYAHHPQDLTGMHKLIRETGWYFFCQRKRKYPNGSRPDRGAGGGVWKVTGKEYEIEVDGKIIGFKNSLEYYEGKNPNDKTDWRMHELRMPDDVAPPIKIGEQGMKLNDCVLCKVYENSRKAKKMDEDETETPKGVSSTTKPLQQQASAYNEGPLAYINGSFNQAIPYSDMETTEPLQQQASAYNGGFTHEYTNQVASNSYMENTQPLQQQQSLAYNNYIGGFTNQAVPYSEPLQQQSSTTEMMREPPQQQQSSHFTDMGMVYMRSMIQPPLMQSSSFGLAPILEAAENGTSGTLEAIVFESFRAKQKKDDDVAVQLPPDDSGKQAEDKDDVILQPDDGGEGLDIFEDWSRELGDIIDTDYLLP
ncbi:NAC domain-containing protein 2-like [Corylus avellana]|uniref:NAC domain-containing protein 2-like n=1 Tax=Corylus avellana TaxID=13451 RepID=UPI00286B67C8|nr:NAC domain-containing protein 2-like [Corylus avellana]